MKKTLAIILAILMIATTIPMAFAAPVEADTPVDKLHHEGDIYVYTNNLTVYYKYDNYLYKVVFSNIKDVVKTGLAYYPSLDGRLLLGGTRGDYLQKNAKKQTDYALISNFPKTVGASMNLYLYYSCSIDPNKPVVVVTCVGVGAPVWTWNGNKATAKFTSTDGNATITVNASVASSAEPVDCLQQTKTIYTATATCNGTAYTDTSTAYGAIKQHDWGEWTVTDTTHSRICKSDASHTESGNHTTDGGKTATCDDPAICGICKTAYGNPEGHKWSEGILTRPTKTEEGYYTYTCSVCDDTKTEPVERASNYVEYNELLEKIKGYLDEKLTDSMMQEINNIITSFDTDANYCYIKGEEANVSQMVEQLSKFIEAVEAGLADGTAVKIDGLEEVVRINDALNEELAEKYGEEALAEITEKLDEKFADKFDELYERAEALSGSVAENKEAIAEIEEEMKAIFAEAENCLAGVHNGLVYEITEEAKCEMNAVESATCTLCGEVLKRDVEDTALEHDIIIDEYKAPTCTETGLKEGSHCSRCADATIAQEVIPALGHDIVIDEAVAGDCTNSGLTAGQHCSRCDGATIAQVFIPATGEHIDADGDTMCDSGGEQLTCPDCGRPVHEGEINEYICLVINIFKLLFSFIMAIK